MDDYLVNLLFVQLAPLLYVFFCLIDYLNNKEDYNNFPKLKDRSIVLAKNIFVYMPITHLIVFSLFPHQVIFKSGFKELMFLIIELIFTDIYFYTTHRMFHHKKLYQKIHRIHHEIKNPIGMFAFYCHPVEMIVVNMGNFYITHMIFNHSYFHNFLMITIGFTNTILKAHNRNMNTHHLIHHHKIRYNYGLDLFMDRLMGTEKMQE